MLFAALLLSPPAQALTLEDIIALTMSGYDEEAILRLIRDTGSVFDLTAQDLVELKKAGVSEKVMQAMIRARAPEAMAERADTLLCVVANRPVIPRILAVLKEKRPYELRDFEGLAINKGQARQLVAPFQVTEEVRGRLRSAGAAERRKKPEQPVAANDERA